ncbi:hypothetical protein BH09ACT13_BH09ACT13_01850 [soil metagenome]
MWNRVSRAAAIGVAVTALALVAMAFDHLVGDDPGLEDPVAFAISAALTLITAAIVFGVVVPRARHEPDGAAKRGFVLSLVSVLGIALIWLGVTFVLAGGAIALGLVGRRGARARLATAAVVIGLVVLGVSTAFSDWASST